jgi:alpha-beta hydrolase superfamily lysophospholipase
LLISTNFAYNLTVVGEQISLTTNDGINISGSYVSSPNPNNIVVLLIHQVRKDKSIWDSLVQKLAASGFSSLAIDLRGHGQSGGGSWEDFSEEQFKAMLNDVEAAGKYLCEKYPAANLSLIGSSIGANLALNYAAKNNASSVVLLSPGLNYKGVATEEASAGFSKPLFMVASRDDPNESVDATLRLSEIVTTPETNLNITTYDDAGHGVNMFTKHPELQDQIVEWLK